MLIQCNHTQGTRIFKKKKEVYLFAVGLFCYNVVISKDELYSGYLQPKFSNCRETAVSVSRRHFKGRCVVDLKNMGS